MAYMTAWPFSEPRLAVSCGTGSVAQVEALLQLPMDIDVSDAGMFSRGSLCICH